MEHRPAKLDYDGQHILCRVCGDKASGFHYGVHSCEGCKGFFRRSIQQKIQYKPCIKLGQCPILRVNRNRCQACRLRKCLDVGMSRDAVRFGRVPKKEKAKIMAEIERIVAERQQQDSPVDLDAKGGLLIGMEQRMTVKRKSDEMETTSLQQSIQVPQQFEQRTVLQRENPQLLLHHETMDSQLPPPQITHKKCRLSPPQLPSNQTPTFTTEKRASACVKPMATKYNFQINVDKQASFVNTITAAHIETSLTCPDGSHGDSKHPPLNGNIKNRPFVLCPLVSNGIVADPTNSAADIWETFTDRFTLAIKKVVEFAKKIPGYSELNPEDQVTLLKAGCFEVLLLRLWRLFDVEKRTLTFLSGQQLTQDELHKLGLGRLLDNMFDFASLLNKLGLLDAEVALFTAAVLVSSDRSGLNNPKAISQLQEKIVHGLKVLMAENHPNDPTAFAKLLVRIPDLRNMNRIHSEKLLLFRMDPFAANGNSDLMHLSEGAFSKNVATKMSTSIGVTRAETFTVNSSQASRSSVKNYSHCESSQVSRPTLSCLISPSLLTSTASCNNSCPISVSSIYSSVAMTTGHSVNIKTEPRDIPTGCIWDTNGRSVKMENVSNVTWSTMSPSLPTQIIKQEPLNLTIRRS